jgi:hypothetical protein
MEQYAKQLNIPLDYFRDLPETFNIDDMITKLFSVNSPTVATYVNFPEAWIKGLFVFLCRFETITIFLASIFIFSHNHYSTSDFSLRTKPSRTECTD